MAFFPFLLTGDLVLAWGCMALFRGNKLQRCMLKRGRRRKWPWRAGVTRWDAGRFLRQAVNWDCSSQRSRWDRIWITRWEICPPPPHYMQLYARPEGGSFSFLITSRGMKWNEFNMGLITESNECNDAGADRKWQESGRWSLFFSPAVCNGYIHKPSDGLRIKALVMVQLQPKYWCRLAVWNECRMKFERGG